MLTKMTIRNFKRIEHADVELGKAVVFIGPNNSGKTTALQALALWSLGVKRWAELRQSKPSTAKKRTGVVINRRDVISIPTPSAKLLWRDLHVRNVEYSKGDGGKSTKNVRIEITIDGITDGKEWSCPLEFDYANEESFYCRPLKEAGGKQAGQRAIPPAAMAVNVAFLPPMSGLAATEAKSEPGRINVLIGEGQTAQVLRNLCHQIYSNLEGENAWSNLVRQIKLLFGVTLLDPEYIAERGEITMAYREPSDIQLDLSASGRGLQQTLLLLAYLYTNPRTVLLLDEPDAHLETRRQEQIYNLLTEMADQQGSQIVAASHSEVVLNEAAGRDVVVAFVGSPHRIDDRGSQVLKSLRDIGFEHYYQAEQTGWVLYLEGSTDLAILRKFAETLSHPAAEYLERPFIHYVGNTPDEVRKHFHGLREAKRDLVGIAIFDRLERALPDDLGAKGLMWRKREIENYLCTREVLLAYAHYDLEDDLFGQAEAVRRSQMMEEAIEEISDALRRLKKPDPWSEAIKASDEFLTPVFDSYFEKLEIGNLLRKSDYHQLAGLIPKDKIDPEVVEKLDAIVEIAKKAKPRKE